MDLWIFLTYVIAVFMGMLYGWHARERHARRAIDRFFIKVEEAVSESSPNRIPIVIERNNGVFYVWNKDDNTFMGQGKTKQELEEVLAKKFPDCKFAAEPENLKVFNESL